MIFGKGRLSPGNGKIIAAHIKKALIKAAPEYASRFEGKDTALAEKIDTLDEKPNTMPAPLDGEKFLVFHPAFGYFADTYGLRQEAIETGGREPAADWLSNLELMAETIRRGIGEK